LTSGLLINRSNLYDKDTSRWIILLTFSKSNSSAELALINSIKDSFEVGSFFV
jgi:hypothetical protein